LDRWEEYHQGSLNMGGRSTASLLLERLEQVVLASKRSVARVRSITISLVAACARYFHKQWATVLLDICSAAIIAVISLRSYIFGSGFYEYADQTWPVSAGVNPPGVFSWSSVDRNGNPIPFEFSRDFLNWPYVVISSLSSNPIFVEKAFIASSFVIFLFLALRFSRQVLRLIGSIDSRLKFGFWTQSGVSTASVLILFTSPFLMFHDVDGGTLADSYIVLIIGEVLILGYRESVPWRLTLCLALLGSVTILLDPDYYLMVLIAILAVLVARCFAGTSVLTLVRVGSLSTFLTFPALLYMLLSLDPMVIANTGAASSFTRPFSLAEAASNARNLSPLTALTETGYFWNTLTFAPPNVYSAGTVGQLPTWGIPSSELLPGGAITSIWQGSLLALPLLLVCALMFRRTRLLAASAWVAGVSGLALALYPFIPGLGGAVAASASIPLAGSLLGTTIVFPDHFLMLYAGASAVLVPVALANLAIVSVSRPTIRSWAKRIRLRGLRLRVQMKIPIMGVKQRFPELARGSHRERIRRTPNVSSSVLPIVFVAIIVFAGWQTFSGTYFPSRAYPAYVGGNGVPDSAPFEPVTPAPEVSKTYSLLLHQPGAFNVFWPGAGANATQLGDGISFFDSSSAPKPLSTLPALPYLVSNNLTADVQPYLNLTKTRYIVVQNTSPVLLDAEFGSSSYQSVCSFFDRAPGMISLSTDATLSLYEDPGSLSMSYVTNLTLQDRSGELEYAVLGSLLASLGKPASFTATDSALYGVSYDEPGSGVTLFSPSALSLLQPIGRAEVGLPNATPVQTNPDNDSWNLSSQLVVPEDVSEPPGNLNLSGWSNVNSGPGPLQVDSRNGIINLTTNATADWYLNPGPALNNGPGGIRVTSPNGNWLGVRMAFQFRSMDSARPLISVYYVALGANSTDPTEFGTTYYASSEWQSADFEAELPPMTEYFTVRIASNFNDSSLSLRYVNFTWNQPSVSTQWVQPKTAIEYANTTFVVGQGGPVNFAYAGQTVSLSSSNQTDAFFNPGPQLTTGVGGIDISNHLNAQVNVGVTFQYRTAENFSGSPSVYDVETNVRGEGLPEKNYPLPSSSSWSSEVLEFTLPPQSAHFTIRFQVVNFVGSIEFSNVRVTWSAADRAPLAPFGTEWNPATSNFTLGSQGRITFVAIDGVVEGPTTELHRSLLGGYRWIEFQGQESVRLLSGSSIVALVEVPESFENIPLAWQTAVYTGQYYPGLEVYAGSTQEYGIESLDGGALFLNVTQSSFRVAYAPQQALELGYALVLGLIMGMSVATIGQTPGIGLKRRRR
jgi:hypothetical protein